MNLPDYNCPAVSLVVFRLGPGNRDLTYLTQRLGSEIYRGSVWFLKWLKTNSQTNISTGIINDSELT